MKVCWRDCLVLATTLMVTGCQDDPRGFVARDWSKAIRELQMTPVFPPREDVQVGDIYIEPLRHRDQDDWLEGNDYLPIGNWMGSVDGITDKVSDFYKNRMVFPKTPRPAVDDQGNVKPDTFEQPTGQRVFDRSRDDTRLRLVAPPTFLSVTFNQENVNAAIPLLGFALGFDNSRAKSVTVSIPQAESYGLPMGRVLGLVRNQTGGLTEATGMAGVALPAGTALRVIQEVYYARVLDVTISTATDFNLDSSLDLDAITNRLTSRTWFVGQKFGASEPTPTPAPTTGNLTTENNSNAGGNGVIFKVVSKTKTQVSLRGIFVRPVAIGFRYFILESQSDGTYIARLPLPLDDSTVRPSLDGTVSGSEGDTSAQPANVRRTTGTEATPSPNPIQVKIPYKAK